MIKKKPSKAPPKKNAPIPLSINIMRFQNYNFNFFATEEVIMFEYLVVKAISFKRKIFYHSSRIIQNETGIKRSRLDTILDRFVKLKILTITVKGMPKVKHYKVHFEKISPLLQKIYEINKLSPDSRKLLLDYFKALAENTK